MPRTCFVIMPFSGTNSCTEGEWTQVFEQVFKPAVEGAGLDYECRRLNATRGNLVAAIMNDLNDSYVVVADLTDRNANVFYELGVRHSLKNRTILLAQRREDIPFDLQAYAYHIYDWRTEQGRTALAGRLAELLGEIDTNPDRSDNPVADFLRTTPMRVFDPAPPAIVPVEAPSAQSLVSPSSEGLAGNRLARTLAHGGRPGGGRTVLRLTRAEMRRSIGSKLEELNRRPSPGQVPQDQVQSIAQDFIREVEPYVIHIEEFALASVEETWSEGIEVGLRLAGEWISLSERRPPGPIIRCAQDAPALLVVSPDDYAG
jgi:hypothetical protein